MMALITICPSCDTTFSVSSEHLQAHNGDVRCGQCNQVFNGFATLITVEESEIEYVSKPTDVPPYSSPSEGETDAIYLLHPSDVSGSEDKAALPLSSYLNRKVVSEDEPEIEVTEYVKEIVDESEILPETNQIADIETPEEHDYFDAIPPRKSHRIWSVACLFLLLLLTGQISYFYRSELVVSAPGTRPYLEGLCALFNCTVPLPQDLSQLSIESSDLQINPEKKPKIITLLTTMRNHASFSQALPALKLTLTGIQGQAIAHRIFTAADYLAEPNDSIHVFEPNHEIDIILYLDSGDLNAAGYRLALHYF